MSLFDRMTPSERAADLGMMVRRLLRHSGTGTVPMLVVEGPSDEALLGAHCNHGLKQVFAAGTRGLVEQMLVYLRSNPIPGCECVFLTDCDGYGKAPLLKNERDLIVTQGCDLEADLVVLGVAERVASVLSSKEEAHELVGTAVTIGLAVSVVRRRAHAQGVSMKLSGQRMRLLDLESADLVRWATNEPSSREVVDAVGDRLGWSASQRDTVTAQVLPTPESFAKHGSGKDVLDILWFLLELHGRRTGMTSVAFQRLVSRHLAHEDMGSWEVARRLRTWQEACGLELVKGIA